MQTTEADLAYLRTLTLLCVEDVPLVQSLLRHSLEGLVGNLVLAGDGIAGLEAFRQHRPHLVLTDIVMPAGDGLSMVEAIHELDATVPIIVTTDYANLEFLVRSIELGVAKYVVKPAHPEVLRGALLTCAHRLAADELLLRQRQLDGASQRLQYQEAMRELARGIGHDFNNLLQGILGAISVAKLSTPPAHQLHGILELADRSANQARELGRRLISLAKSAGSLNHVGPLTPLLRTTVEAALKGSNCVACFELPDALPDVAFDEQDLRMLTELVVSNAMDAMPSGGTLTLAAQVRTVSPKDQLGLPPGTFVRYSFSDTGSGLAPEILDRIFNPYFTTKVIKNQKGVGLSLAICQAIARSHGGVLSAEAQPAGAVFHLYLPVHRP